MAEWVITDEEIETIEKLLLPPDKHFADDAKDVIRFWDSTDVAACPGSGKTTVLLAKLKLLADRMPLEDGSGICVLSHTNVAVDEIKTKLSNNADKLLSYPNYFGTIQSFVDRFVTMQYIKGRYKTNLQFVSDEEYARYFYNWIWRDRTKNSPYNSLRYYIRKKYQLGTQYEKEEEYYQHITVGVDGIYHNSIKLAGFSSDSGKQYLQAKYDLLKNDGILLYSDTYVYANEAIDALSKEYTELFSKRFRYIFIDEYQDCDEAQRKALEKLFDVSKSCVMRIGDSDQAIYNGMNAPTTDWAPKSGCMTIVSSCRYSQEIANILVPLRKNGENIVASSGTCGNKPVIIVFDRDNPGCVVEEYANQIISRGLNETNATHYAVGFRRNATSGLTVGSYWNGFDGASRNKPELNYWLYIDAICIELSEGRLYRVENLTRQIIYMILRILGIKDADTGKNISHSVLHRKIRNEYKAIYSDFILQLSRVDFTSKEIVDQTMRYLVKTLLKDDKLFEKLPKSFLDNNSPVDGENEKNLCTSYGVNIRFDTIHSVKGQTHSTTLYLETEYKNGSDLARILHLYGAGNGETKPIYDYSRKLAYVGMSRPRKLLCVAMQSSTYDKSKGVFENDLWEVVDLRKKQ